VYTGDRLGDRISYLCDHIRRHFLGHNRANNERLLSTINMEGTSAGKASLHSRICLAARMHYVNTFLLSKIWYTAQILPAPNIYTQQLATAITWYILRGTVFRVPVSTLQRPKQTEGCEMPDIEAKCTAFLLYRMYLQGQRNGTLTAAWLQTWNLSGRQENPPHAT